MPVFSFQKVVVRVATTELYEVVVGNRDRLFLSRTFAVAFKLLNGLCSFGSLGTRDSDEHLARQVAREEWK